MRQSFPLQVVRIFFASLEIALGRRRHACSNIRNKIGSTADLITESAVLREAMPREKVKLILDDREDLVLEAEFDGVHVDSGDVSPGEARWLLGPEKIIGTYGGSDSLLPEVFTEPANYLRNRSSIRNQDQADQQQANRSRRRETPRERKRAAALC